MAHTLRSTELELQQARARAIDRCVEWPYPVVLRQAIDMARTLSRHLTAGAGPGRISLVLTSEHKSTNFPRL
jgi:hypothetical protein